MSSNYKRPGVNATDKVNWNGTTTTVQDNSGSWAVVGDLTEIAAASGGWNSTETSWNATSGNIAINTTNIDYLSSQIDSENLWDLDGTTITPSSATNTVTLPYLAGTNNTITTTNATGLFQDSTATITEGVSGGSLLNMDEHSVDPLNGSLVVGDLWITDNIATSGKLLKFWDGTYKYSVELSRE